MGKVIIYQDAVRRLLSTPETRLMLGRKANRVAAAARSQAPVGNAEKQTRLRDSHEVRFEPATGTNRARYRVVANKPYAARVASRNNWLARALSAAKE